MFCFLYLGSVAHGVRLKFNSTEYRVVSYLVNGILKHLYFFCGFVKFSEIYE